MRLPDSVREYAKGAVARGAARLDHRRPNWYQQIDVRRLDLADGCQCIIGQLYGTYESQYLRRVINNLSPNSHVTFSAPNYGFSEPIEGPASEWLAEGSSIRDTSYYRLLDRLWIQEIENRREADLKRRLEAESVAPRRARVAA